MPLVMAEPVRWNNRLLMVMPQISTVLLLFNGGRGVGGGALVGAKCSDLVLPLVIVTCLGVLLGGPYADSMWPLEKASPLIIAGLWNMKKLFLDVSGLKLLAPVRPLSIASWWSAMKVLVGLLM